MTLTVVAGVNLGASVQADQYFDFSSPIPIGPSPAPGVWYTDRHAPYGFASQSGLLLETINPADHDSSSDFYNTQGRAYDLQAGTTSMSIDVFVDKSWSAFPQPVGVDRPLAGFWGVAETSTVGVLAYPILEIALATDGTLGYRTYDGTNGYGAVTALSQNEFHSLGLAVVGSDFVYSVDGATVLQTSAQGATSLDSVILQGYNGKYGAPLVYYSVNWDNLATTNGAVPEPSSIISAVLGFAGAGLLAARRARNARAQAAA